LKEALRRPPQGYFSWAEYMRYGNLFPYEMPCQARDDVPLVLVLAREKVALSLENQRLRGEVAQLTRQRNAMARRGDDLRADVVRAEAACASARDDLTAALTELDRQDGLAVSEVKCAETNAFGRGRRRAIREVRLAVAKSMCPSVKTDPQDR
jgi:hypothetical protein